jgi:hypothetical protein
MASEAGLQYPESRRGLFMTPPRGTLKPMLVRTHTRDDASRVRGHDAVIVQAEWPDSPVIPVTDDLAVSGKC